MCSLQVIADFLSCVVNFWPGDDFLGDSSAKTSIFPYNFLERQSCRDPYLSIRISIRGGLGQRMELSPCSAASEPFHAAALIRIAARKPKKEDYSDYKVFRREYKSWHGSCGRAAIRR